MNNNKKTITICSIVALIILAIVVVVTLISDLTGFSIVFGAFFIVLTICLAIYLREEPDEFNAFIKTKKRILRTYDSVIVEVEDIPNIAGKNIIKVKSIEDLVDAQLELREPIYYKNDNDSCFFILLHFNEACIYVLRMNDSVVSPTEQSIRYMKEETTDKTKEQENILENLEKTVVYKLDELRSFKISPIRNNEKINVVDDTAIKKEIETSKDLEITSSALSSELSKTMYLKDLRERMLKYEEENLAKTKKLTKTTEEPKEIKEEKVEEVKEEKVEEVSPIERLKKIVKEKEQELTKELKLNNSKEEIKESEPSPRTEIELDIVDSTEEKVLEEPKKETIKETVSRVEKHHEEDDIINGVVVLQSLEEDDEELEDDIPEIEEDVPFAPVVITDFDEVEESVESEEEIKVLETTSINIEEPEQISSEEIDDISDLDVTDELTIVEETSSTTPVETVESEVNELSEETKEIKEPNVEIKEKTNDVNKTRKNPKPTRKVTHSTRRAQRHTNRTKR